jgi:type II secretory pathway component PulF
LGPRGDFVLYCVIVGLLLGTAFVLIQGILKGWFGEWPMRIARRIPLVGKTVEALSLSRLAWTLSMAENSGMGAAESAKLSLESTQNYYYDRLIEPIQNRISQRESFYEAFDSTGAFHEDFLIHVQNGETTGRLAETMDHVSKVYQEQAENNLKALSVIGFVLTFLLVAAIIVAVVILMYMELYIKPINDALNFR